MTQRTYEKAVEMDPAFGQQKEIPVIHTPEPRREFDPEHADRYDEQGRFIARWRRNRNRGQGLAEYALILALIAVVAIIAIAFLGQTISGFLSQTGNSI